MPRMIVMSEPNTDSEGAVTLDERVASSDLRSGHRSAELIERLGWAVPRRRRRRARVGGRSARVQRSSSDRRTRPRRTSEPGSLQAPQSEASLALRAATCAGLMPTELLVPCSLNQARRA